MRWNLGKSILVLSILTLVPVSVSADTVTSTQQIKITAVVAEARYVVVDSQNQIQEIITNSYNANVVPTVYQDLVRQKNSRPLTVELQRQCDALLKGKAIKPGILYKRPLSPPAVPTVNDTKLLALLAQHKTW